VGRDWERKGGELVVATAYCLIKLGHQVTLNVVGCDLPARYRGLPWIVSYGSLSPRVPLELIQLHELFAQAHFVFVPSRAEAYGMTFAEANAFGVPAVATATGGIPAVVRDGHNGMLLPLEARASAYADAIAEAFSSHDRYRQMCHRAFDTFEQRLNWRVFCRRFLELAEARCLRPVATPVAAAPVACPVP
jgi:glycosyltransferase involved in cell wall biosynthesis